MASGVLIRTSTSGDEDDADERSPLLERRSPVEERSGSNSGPGSSTKKHQHHRHHDDDATHDHDNGRDPDVSFTHSHNSATDVESSNTSRVSDEGSHCHRRSSEEEIGDRAAMKKLAIASAMCLAFMIAEVIGGILANSLAIATDAAHLLTDFTSFMISLLSVYIASRPATKRMSFGFYRAEVIGALISILLIWVVTAVLVYMAVLRVISEDYKIDASIMLITAALGVAFNIFMGIVLSASGHEHSHGGMNHGHAHGHAHNSNNNKHSHSNGIHESQQSQSSSQSLESSTRSHDVPMLLPDEDPDRETIRLQTSILDLDRTSDEVVVKDKTSRSNINVNAALIHVLGDLLQSVGILIAAYIIYYKPEWKLADPICTFLFSVLVVFTTVTILRDILNVLMEGVPRGISFNDVKDTLRRIKGVREIHNLRLWSLSVSRVALSVHLAIDDTVNTQEVLASAANLMREKFGIYECTVQTELYVDEMEDCTRCQDPRD